MRMSAPKEGSCDPIAPLELPHSLHAFHRASQADTLNKVSNSSVHFFLMMDFHVMEKSFFIKCIRQLEIYSSKG